MNIDASDIREEFKQLTSFDFRGNTTIGAIFESFDRSPFGRPFSINKERECKTYWGMINPEKITQFSAFLLEYGNVEYCRKKVGISKEKSLRIVKILNEAAEQRGLHPVYIFKPSPPKSKLLAKQVSIIKYLLHKGYSENKLASIYKVHQATINHISNRRTWINVNPIIDVPDIRVVHINQYVTSEVQKEEKPFIPFLENEEQSAKFFDYIIFGDGPQCPRCLTKNPYLLSKGRLKCRNSSCWYKFTLTCSTPFENTKMKPSRWLAAMYLYNKDQSISTYKLAEYIGVSQKSAFNIKKRLKTAFLLPLWQRFYIINEAIGS